MKIVHFCAGLEGWNGMANTARQFVAEELVRGDESQLTNDVGIIERMEKIDRVQIHGTWLPVLWKVAKLAKRKGAELIVRPCGNYDPIRIRRGAIKRLKKWLVGPLEHAMLNRADFVQCTCVAEAEWVKAYHPKAQIRLTGNFSVVLEIPCDRCLTPCNETVECEFDQELFSEEELSKLDEAEEVSFLHNTEFDVYDFVNLNVLMNMPSKVLCQDDCKGLCPVCGSNLNETDCGCDSFVPDPRMARIADIFNESKEV